MPVSFDSYLISGIPLNRIFQVVKSTELFQKYNTGILLPRPISKIKFIFDGQEIDEPIEYPIEKGFIPQLNGFDICHTNGYNTNRDKK